MTTEPRRGLAPIPGIEIPASALSYRFSRSGGPGGQNVNKVASRVEVILDSNALADCLGTERASTVRNKLERFRDADGNLRVVCDEHRTQRRNIEGALDRLERLIAQSLHVRRRRLPTKPTRGSRERRLDAKRQNSQRKQSRRNAKRGRDD